MENLFLCLNGRAPAYLADDCRWTRHCRPGLWSSSEMMKQEVPSTRTTFGDRSFAVDEPRVWNGLPASIHVLSFLVDLRVKIHLRRLRIGTDAHLYILTNRSVCC